MQAANIEDILSRASQDIRKLLQEAFEAGRAKEREEIKRNIFGYLLRNQTTENAPDAKTHDSDIAAYAEGRAKAGTVKPAIKELIQNAPIGILTAEIVEKTGFKENSVRGTLSALKAEGFADRRGDLWFASQRKGPLDAASGPS